MATLTIHYHLTTAGQRADLIAGGTGKYSRTVEVEATPVLIAVAAVDRDGRLSYDLHNRRGVSSASHDYDHVLTDTEAAAEVLRVEADFAAAEAKVEAEKAAEKVAARARWNEAAAAALADDPVYWVSARPDGSNGVIVQHRGTLLEHTIYASDCGVSNGEVVELVAQFAPIAATRAEAQRLADEREAERERQAATAAEAALAERDAWIRAHGSDRLKKGLAAGLIDKMAGVYRSERVRMDLGDEWRAWDDVDEDHDSERINPREPELDALLEARKRWPDEALEVQLRSVRTEPDEYGEGGTKWRPALMVRLPWELDRWAVRYLDLEAKPAASAPA